MFYSKRNIYIHIHLHIQMSKLINISNEVYERLTVLKEKESYTNVIKKLLEKKSNREAILACAGKGGIKKEALKSLRKDWKKWSDKYV